MVKYGKVCTMNYNIQVLTSMAKYGIVCIIMKITVTIPDNVYDKLEGDKGLIPRSSFIQELIKGWQNSETKLGEFSTEVSISASKPEDAGSSPVAPAKESSELIKSSTPEFKTYFKEKKSGKQK